MLISSFNKLWRYRQLSLKGHLFKTDSLLKRTLGVGPCLSLLLLVDSIYDKHVSKMDTWCGPQRCPSSRELTVYVRSQIWFQANFDLSLVDSLFPFSLTPYYLWISDVKRQRKLEENQPRLKKLNLNNLFWNFKFDQCNIYSCILAYQNFFPQVHMYTFNKSCFNHLIGTL